MTRFAPEASQGSTFTLALAGFVVRALKRMTTALKNRQEVRMLSQLDDRALKDIGLMRTDVQAALSSPLHLDPSLHLIDVAGHKRSGSKPALTPLGSNLSSAGAARLRRPDAPVTPAALKPAAC
jgi:uncharacterized protein YjiS (DUF1127 family)